MKKVSYLAIGLISAGLVSGVSMREVSAEVVTGQTRETPVTVDVKDSDETVDPLDPTDPTQQRLLLKKVPENYNFETTLKNEDYTIEATLEDEKVTVFNDRSVRDWSVKASVTDNQISSGNTIFDVSSFKVNNVELVGTGATGVVAKSAEDKTVTNNTGTLSTAIESVNIEFSDAEGTLKVGSQLSLTISYSLYNTSNAD